MFSIVCDDIVCEMFLLYGFLFATTFSAALFSTCLGFLCCDMISPSFGIVVLRHVLVGWNSCLRRHSPRHYFQLFGILVLRHGFSIVWDSCFATWFFNFSGLWLGWGWTVGEMMRGRAGPYQNTCPPRIFSCFVWRTVSRRKDRRPWVGRLLRCTHIVVQDVWRTGTAIYFW